MSKDKLDLGAILARATLRPWRRLVDDTGSMFSGWPYVDGPPSVDHAIIHRAGFKQKYWESCSHGEAMANAALIVAAVNSFEIVREALLSAQLIIKRHHDWHNQSGEIGLPDGEGGWIEIDNAAEYGDSALCADTMRVLDELRNLTESRSRDDV